MQIIKSNDVFPDSLKGAIVAIGNFDGVHIGHRELIANAKIKAAENKSNFGIITFNPHPALLFGREYKYIYDTQYKYEVLSKLGLDFVYEIEFNDKIASLSPEEFVKEILVNTMKIDHIISGYNYRFGNKRAGDAAMLSELAKRYGFLYSQINQISSNHLNVSSTAIKQLISEGRMTRAAHLMCRSYTISGKIATGRNLAGKVLNHPTANVHIPHNMALPRYGVYLVKAKLEDGSKHYGVANIGLRPTVNEDKIPLLEIHLLEFNADIVGALINVEFISFMRPERKFDGLEQLKMQIEQDVKNARYLLREMKYEEKHKDL